MKHFYYICKDYIKYQDGSAANLISEIDCLTCLLSLKLYNSFDNDKVKAANYRIKTLEYNKEFDVLLKD